MSAWHLRPLGIFELQYRGSSCFQPSSPGQKGPPNRTQRCPADGVTAQLCGWVRGLKLGKKNGLKIGWSHRGFEGNGGQKLLQHHEEFPFVFVSTSSEISKQSGEDLRLLCKESLFFNLKGASYSFERHWSFLALSPLKASKIPSLQPLPVIPFFSLLGLHTKTPLNPLEDMYTVHCISLLSLSLYAYVSIYTYIYTYIYILYMYCKYLYVVLYVVLYVYI